MSNPLVYSSHGINEFIICCGYLGYVIKEYFTNLCCDDYTIPFLKGGQSNADSALNNLNIIGINYKDNENNAKQFLSELGNPYTNIITDPNGINSIELGAFGVPETYLIENKSKLIIKKFIGPLDDKSFIQLTKIIQ